MNPDMKSKNFRCLEASIDQLTEEHQLNFLGVLEALTFAQNMREMPIEPETIQGNKYNLRMKESRNDRKTQ